MIYSRLERRYFPCIALHGLSAASEGGQPSSCVQVPSQIPLFISMGTATVGAWTFLGMTWEDFSITSSPVAIGWAMSDTGKGEGGKRDRGREREDH